MDSVLGLSLNVDAAQVLSATYDFLLDFTSSLNATSDKQKMSFVKDVLEDANAMIVQVSPYSDEANLDEVQEIMLAK